MEPEASVIGNPSKVTPSPEFFKLHREYANKDYEYLRNQQLPPPPIPHHYLHHQHLHPYLHHLANNHGKLVTAPHLRNHHQLIHYPLNNINNNNNNHNHHRNLFATPQLTPNVPSYVHMVEQPEDERRSPTKLAYDAINYIIQRTMETDGSGSSSNKNDLHHYHFYHMPNQAYAGVQESENLTSSSSNKPNIEYSKIFADHHQLMRRPSSVLLMNPELASSIRVPYTAPVQQSTTTKNIIFNKSPMDNLRMQLPPQMMIVPRRSQTLVKRPILMTPPSQQQQQQLSSLTPVSKSPVFYERKKAVYKSPMLSRMQTLLKPPPLNYYPTKLVKIEAKPHLKAAKIELKPSQIETFSSEHKPNLLRPMIMKPARNTGFDPGSIVIEKGFKPILRHNLNNEEKSGVERRAEISLQDDVKEATSEKYNDSFEPVFIPSYPDRGALNKPSKKKLHKLKLKSEDVEKSADTYLQPPSVATPSRRSPKAHTLVDTVTPISNTTLPLNSTFLEIQSNKTERVKRFAQNDHNHHDHSSHDHHHHEESDSTHQASTGEIILANLEYIVLTVVMYYAL